MLTAQCRHYSDSYISTFNSAYCYKLAKYLFYVIVDFLLYFLYFLVNTCHKFNQEEILHFCLLIFKKSDETLKLITMGDCVDQNEPPKDPKELEKLEEAKLKAKFPNAMLGKGPSGHSAFLAKRLAKGQKFFDSGDYQMAKQRPSNLAAPFKTPAVPPKLPTGDAIPTPDTVPVRKTSIIQPKYQPPSQTS